MNASESAPGLFGSTISFQTTPIKALAVDSSNFDAASSVTGDRSAANNNVDDVEKDLLDTDKMAEAVRLNQKLRAILLDEEDRQGLEGFDDRGDWSHTQAMLRPSSVGYRTLGKTLAANPRLPRTYDAKPPPERTLPLDELKARGGLDLPRVHGFHLVGGKSGRYEKYLRAPTNIELNERKKRYSSTGFSHHETYEYAYIKVMRPLLKGNALEKRKVRIQNKHIHHRLTKCIRSTGYGTWEKKRPTFTFEIEEEKRKRPAVLALNEANEKYAKVTAKVERRLLSWDRLPRELTKEMEAVHSLYMEAKKKGHPGASTSLGRMYWYGEGVAEDRQMARGLWNQASELGWAEADLYLTVVANDPAVLALEKKQAAANDEAASIGAGSSTTGGGGASDSGSTQLTTTLTFTLERARDLVDADRGGTSDPFAILELVDRATGQPLPRPRKLKTKTITRSLDPEWEEHMTWADIFEDPGTLALSVLVFDADTLTCELLGGVTIPLAQGMDSEEWYPLSNVEGRELLKNEVASRKDATGAVFLHLKTELKARKVIKYQDTLAKLEADAARSHAGAQCALAFELWQRAYDGARHGIAAAGEDGAADYGRAYELWLAAAKAGEPTAQRMVAYICDHYGDRGQAVVWLTRSARQGDEESQLELDKRFGDGKMEKGAKLYPNPTTTDRGSGFLASTWSVNSG
jgi:TPR repeat protein